MAKAFQAEATAKLESTSTNLPIYLTSFVGRKRELGEIKKLLERPSLLTLTGTGGVGKTRLAAQFARAEARQYPAGVWFVALAPLTDKRYAIEAIVQVLNIKDASGQPLEQTLINSLQDQQLLLILDNCEHLLDECARLAGLLLSKCAGLKILATSREGLGIDGEVTFRVPSLAVPIFSDIPHPERVIEYEAVRLFVERTQAAEPSFDLSEKTIRSVIQICNQLDGIPLALELAAARLGSLPVEQLANRLNDRFRLLTNGNRISLPRQQTLRALVDWSYNLLETREQVVLGRLAVFAGKWTLEAAEEICQGQYTEQGHLNQLKHEEVLELILQLVNKSLVQLDQAEGRYYLLETIRQYAREKLAEADETEKYFRQHRDWYLRFALEAEKNLTGPEQVSWKRRITQEHAEIRAALDWSLGQGELVEAARIVLGLWYFWHITINIKTIRWLDQLYHLSEKTELPPELKVRLYNALGNVRHSMGNYQEAEFFHLKALQLWRDMDDKGNTAKALLDLGWYYQFQMKLVEAEQYARESLQLAQEMGDRRAIAAAIHLRAMALSFDNRPKEAIPLLEECLAIWRELGDLDSISSSLLLLAQSEMKLGNYERAKPLLAETLTLQLELQNLLGTGITLIVVAMLMLATKKNPQSVKLSARFVGISHKWYEELILHGAKKPGMAEAIEESVVKELKQILGEKVYAQEYAAGAKITPEEALNLAIQLINPQAEEEIPSSVSPEYPNGLSGREVEIVRLVAAGLSNPEIAEKLVISRRTVEAHLRSIFNKLEVTSRAAVTRFALEHNLT